MYLMLVGFIHRTGLLNCTVTNL